MTFKRLATRVLRSGKIVAAMAAVLVAAGCASQRAVPENEITISLLGTNDVHGQLLPDGDRGGLVAISGYVSALRAARDEDGGALLVIDAGDMWQGTLESNLVEGEAVVDAYNAIGFDAAAIGNHEFDFGPEGPKAIPETDADDPRGALKRQAAKANFPLLAANLIDAATDEPVTWDNVRPSVMLDVKGLKVGIIGITTANALRTTIAANVTGLRVAPLAETVIRESTVLRNKGAAIVIVTAHAGSSCTEFSDPMDLSSCHTDGEIMRLADAIPRGLVDHIFAGHVHRGIAHVVNGISITSSFSNTRAFSRVDLRVDTNNGRIVSREIHAPHWACLRVIPSTGECVAAGRSNAEAVSASYEGRAITPDPVVMDIAERAANFAAAAKNEELGVELLAPFSHPPATESPLANLMTDAIRQQVDGDVAIHNVVGGIRNILPAGELTFGAVYEMFPFDNRIATLELTGRELRQLISTQAHRARRRAGFSGLRVFVSCAGDAMDIVLQLSDGSTVQDDDLVTLIANDFLVLGGDDVLTPIIPDDGIPIDYSQPLLRDALVEWFRSQGETLDPTDYQSTDNPRWNVPDPLPATCSL
ncbi:MAG: 5'-nucleotidase C-terminal domain-containing protein [Gammaproteobacteria bacterium]|nr:5'-nucleotidase C-terminal domain-containing protein [Gammaproteobacteria bacterium]